MHKEKLDTPELIVDDNQPAAEQQLSGALSELPSSETESNCAATPNPVPTSDSDSTKAPICIARSMVQPKRKPFWKCSKPRKAKTIEERKSNVIFGIVLTTVFSIAGLYLTRQGTVGHGLMIAGACAAAFFGAFAFIHLTNPRWYSRIPFDHSVSNLKAFAIWKSFSVLGLTVMMISMIFGALNLDPKMSYHYRIGLPLLAVQSLFDCDKAILNCAMLYKNTSMSQHAKSAFAYRKTMLRHVHKLPLPPSGVALDLEPPTPPATPREAGLRALMHWGKSIDPTGKVTLLAGSELMMELQEQNATMSTWVTQQIFESPSRDNTFAIRTKHLNRSLALLPEADAKALIERLKPIKSRGVSIIDMRSRLYKLTDAPASDTHLVDARELLGKLKTRTGPLPPPIQNFQAFRDDPEVNAQANLFFVMNHQVDGRSELQGTFPHALRTPPRVYHTTIDGHDVMFPQGLMPIDYAVVSSAQMKALEAL